MHLIATRLHDVEISETVDSVEVVNIGCGVLIRPTNDGGLVIIIRDGSEIEIRDDGGETPRIKVFKKRKIGQ